MKFRFVWLAILFAFSLTRTVQAADDWKTYRYPLYGFAAEFPAAPVLENDRFDPKREVRNIQYWLGLDDVSYGVNAALFHHNVIAGRPPDELIRNAMEGARSSLECSIHSQRAIAFPGGTAREIIFNKCQGAFVEAKARILIVGDWYYLLLVLGKKPGTAENPDAQRFLKSFSIVTQ